MVSACHRPPVHGERADVRLPYAYAPAPPDGLP